MKILGGCMNYCSSGKSKAVIIDNLLENTHGFVYNGVWKQEVFMPSNLNFNPQLLVKAQQLSGLKYKKDVIDLALTEFVKRHEQVEIIKLFHKIPYDDDYDHKQGRKKR